MKTDSELVGELTEEIDMILSKIQRQDCWSAKLYGQACYLAGLDQLRQVLPETEVIEYLRHQADQSEAALIHAHKLTGKVFGTK